MADWTSLATDVLWRNGLSAIPIVGTVALAAKLFPCRPATRHMMWLTVLAWFVVPPLLPPPPTPQLASFIERHVAAPSTTTPAVTLNVEPIQTALPDPTSAIRALIELSTLLAEEHRSEARVEANDNSPALESLPVLQPDVPSPRLVARPADREPDLLAQASDAGGPLSLLPISNEIGKEKPAPFIQNPERKRTENQSRERKRPDSFSHEATELRSHEGRGSRPNQNPERKRRALDAKETIVATEVLPRFLEDEVEASTATVLSDIPVSLPDTHIAPVSPWRRYAEATAASGVVAIGYLWTQFVESMQGGAWVASLKAIRDDVMGLPPIPMPIWFGGVALFFLISAGKVWRFRRFITSAVAPTPQVLKTVAAASKELGLSAPPRTLMIDGRVSPMIWCGLRPTLLIPSPLWSQLDEAGRRAVLFHELAHVRRRDHVVHWIESAIGIVYWWHPLVWWVRRCLHAEAEVCCDAWVTTLMPRRRRAFAEALLITQQYVDATDRPTPTLGIGVTTGRARRFARRLTMVMTESTKPRLSFSGFAMVLAMATVGWLASPASSCPDHDAKAAAPKASSNHKCCGKSGDCKCAKAGSGGHVNATGGSTPCVTVAVGAAAPSAPTRATAPVVTTSVGGVAVVAPVAMGSTEPVAVARHAVAGGVSAAPVALVSSGPKRHSHEDDDDDADDDDDGDDDERLERLESRLERMNERLERLMGALEGQHGAMNHAGPTPPPAPMPRSPRPPQPGAAPAPMIAPMPPMPAMPPMEGMLHAEGGTKVWKKYELPKEKLQALTNLMSRPDVPVLVRPGDEAIEVQGTPGQHRIFGAFVKMIDPENDSVSMGPLDGAKLGDEIRARVEREAAGQAAQIGREARAKAREVEREMKRRAKEIEKRERKRSKVGSKSDEIRSMLTQEMERQEALEREAEAFAEQAERMSEEADELRERNDELASRASREKDRDARLQLEREALELRHRAEQLDEEKERLESQARQIEDNAREAEDAAREAEDRMRNLEEELREIAEEEASQDADDMDDEEHAFAVDTGDDDVIWQLVPAAEDESDLPGHDDDDDSEDNDD